MEHKITKNYSIEDLRNPKTYEDNEGLARFARQHAQVITHEHNLDRPIGQTKRELLAGEHAEILWQYVRVAYDEYEKTMNRKSQAEKKSKQIIPPDGYTIDREDNNLIISGEFNSDLHARIKRAGGRWDGKYNGGTDRRVWIISIEDSTGLDRIFRNWEKSQQKRAIEIAERVRVERDRERERYAAELRREREEAEEHRRTQIEMQAEQVERKSRRVKVRVGEYSVGDELYGRKITSFGATWTEKIAPREMLTTQIWDECRCGSEPVYIVGGSEAIAGVMDSGAIPEMLCESCIAKQYGTEQVEVCYAYRD